jgi:hypothetical protein
VSTVIELEEDRVRRALADAGIEIYRVKAGEICIAERIRVHLMDSGIRIVVGSAPKVRVTVRSQRSDFPNASSNELFSKVRAVMTPLADARGFVEAQADARAITDPVDASHVLDVWHELTYEKAAPHLDAAIEDVRWSLGLPRCVTG